MGEVIKNEMIKNKRSAFGSADEVRGFESGILFKKNSFLLFSCFFQIKEAMDLEDLASSLNRD